MLVSSSSQSEIEVKVRCIRSELKEGGRAVVAMELIQRSCPDGHVS